MELYLCMRWLFDETVLALLAKKANDREWFIENLLAATSPGYLVSLEEARRDFREGRTNCCRGVPGPRLV